MCIAQNMPWKYFECPYEECALVCVGLDISKLVPPTAFMSLRNPFKQQQLIVSIHSFKSHIY